MATDFFHQQDLARRQTGRLIVLFALSVVVIIAAVYGVATLLVENVGGDPSNKSPLLDWGRLAIVATVVLLVITSGSLYKIAMLREGGEAIAHMLGGRLLNPSTREISERRLLNVVEEMALAAGTPVPPVYVLDDEPGINAFAAGFTPGDAVVAVSRGSLERLTRDELQGVMGHEFSHILNGDMRLNLRLIGLVHGILVLALIGQLLIRSVSRGTYYSSRRSRDEGGGSGVVAALMIAGVGLFVIGSIGVFLGRLIKCAISRQREFLADASSVQFTRNPDGIVGALEKIGGLSAGSRIQNPNAEQACHMFFGQGVPSFAQLLATHPPLEERIRRLDPTFDGKFPAVSEGTAAAELDGDGGRRAGASGFAPRPRAQADARIMIPLDPEAAVASVGAPTEAHVRYAESSIDWLSPALAAAAREPFAARAVIYALLLDPDPAVRNDQVAHLDAHSEPGTRDEVLALLPETSALGENLRIPLVDLTFPALRRLSDVQYRSFRVNVDTLVKADRRVSLFEYALQRMLLRHLDQAFLRLPPPRVRYESIDPVFRDCVVLLSTLARLGHQEGDGVFQAFSTGMARLQDRYPGERAVELLPPEQCSLAGVERALKRLTEASPPVKKRVLDACASCIAFDGLVTIGEGELLRAIADSLDCPMPPLLARPLGLIQEEERQASFGAGGVRPASS